MLSILIRLVPLAILSLCLWYVFSESHDGFVALLQAIEVRP